MYPEHFCVPKTMVASVSAQTPVLTNFLKKHIKNTENYFEPMYPAHFCAPKTMVASVSAQTPF